MRLRQSESVMRIALSPELQRLKITNPLHWIATGFGSGLSPVAPGTAGSLAAIPFYLGFQHLSEAGYVLTIVFSFFLGVWATQNATDAIGVDDHGALVWDEFVGMWITLFVAPPGWLWIVLGFILFRIFDIIKPWPIRPIDRRLHGGWGIMLDDVLAGIFAWLSLQLLYTLLQQFG